MFSDLQVHDWFYDITTGGTSVHDPAHEQSCRCPL